MSNEYTQINGSWLNQRRFYVIYHMLSHVIYNTLDNLQKLGLAFHLLAMLVRFVQLPRFFAYNLVSDDVPSVDIASILSFFSLFYLLSWSASQSFFFNITFGVQAKYAISNENPHNIPTRERFKLLYPFSSVNVLVRVFINNCSQYFHVIPGYIIILALFFRIEIKYREWTFSPLTTRPKVKDSATFIYVVR